MKSHAPYHLCTSIFLCGLLLCSQAAVAEPDRHINPMQRMAQALHLSEKQKQDIQNIQHHIRPNMQHIKQAMQKNRQALHQLIPGSKGYHEELEQLAEQQGKLSKAKIIQQGRMQAEIYSILTPKQRKQFLRFKQRHPAMQHHRPVMP